MKKVSQSVHFHLRRLWMGCGQRHVVLSIVKRTDYLPGFFGRFEASAAHDSWNYCPTPSATAAFVSWVLEL